MVLTDIPIVLASQSPRRIHLLQEAGFRVEVIPSHAEEKDARYHDIGDIVMENGRIKGGEVVTRLAQAGRSFARTTLLIAADTLVVMGEKVYGKPRDMAEAERFQLELSGVEHQVYTGVYVHNLHTGNHRSFYEVTGVTLKHRNLAEIREYFTKVNPLDKAAAYGFQDAREIVETMVGSDTNVIGLPMEHLTRVITEMAK